MDSGTLPFQIINISYLNCTYLRRMAYLLWRFMNSTSNIGEFLFESIFLPPILNDNKYRQFLETQLPLILEGIPLQIRNQMWFMHEEASSSIFQSPAQEFLNNNYINRWIDRGGLIAWSARSPDLNPLNFYGHILRSLCIIILFLQQFMRRRCKICINAERNHFQQFL